MAKTVKQVRDNAIELVDATGTVSSWGTTFGGELDLYLDAVHDKVWSRILSTNKAYRWRQVSATSDANGQFTVATLSDTTTSNDHKRLHRILAMTDANGAVYIETEFDKIPTAKLLDAQIYTWYRIGKSIQVLPVTASKVYTVTVNYKPTKPTSFSAETQAIDFPDGWEHVLEYGLASKMLQKAGDEVNMAEYYKREMENEMDEMLQELARQGTWPMFPQYSDSASDWGG